MSLADELAIFTVNQDELVTLLASSFPLGEWHGGNTVVYRAAYGEVAATLTYREGRLDDLEAGPGLSKRNRERLRDDIAALAVAHETVVCAEVFFGILPVNGTWRYRDEWQIVPTPPLAPRPNVVIADHPFIIELRVPSYSGRGMLDATISQRRAWELQLMLNLVLRGHIKRFGVRAANQVWATVWDNDDPVTTKWVQPGYFIPN